MTWSSLWEYIVAKAETENIQHQMGRIERTSDRLYTPTLCNVFSGTGTIVLRAGWHNVKWNSVK